MPETENVGPVFQQPRVIIIGAGMAGLAAASALLTSTDGRIFEVGAGWLHYTDTELYRICAENNFIEHAKTGDATRTVHVDDDLILDHALVFSDMEKPLRRSNCQVIYDNLDIVDLLVPPPAVPLANDADFKHACRSIGDDKSHDKSNNSSFGDVLLKKYAAIDVRERRSETSQKLADSLTDYVGEHSKMTSRNALQRQLKLAAIDLSARIVLDDFGARSLFDISLGVGHQEESGSGAYLTRLKVPLSYLTDRVRTDIPDRMLQLGCSVKQIQFLSNNRYPVKLICQKIFTDGKSETVDLYADHVIITISVGALKTHYAELFHRSSPITDAKKLAIEGFGMGYMGNLFFQFPVDAVSGKTWWQQNIPKWKPFMTLPPPETDLIEHNMPFAMHMIHIQPEVLECGLKFMLSRSPEQADCSFLVDAEKSSRHQFHKISCNWTRYISGLYFFPILQRKSRSSSDDGDEFENDHSWCKILLPGGVSHFVDSLSDDCVLREFSAFIRRMTGDPNIPDAVQVIRRRWGSEPGYYGSFSYPSVACAKNFGSSGSDVLGRPEWMYEKRFENENGESVAVKMPGLLFAGEATSTTGLGYMHGAYDSGKREARRIIETYQKFSFEPIHISLKQ